MHVQALQTLARSISTLGTLHQDAVPLMFLNNIHHTILNEVVAAGLQPVRSHMVGVKTHQRTGVGFLFQAEDDPLGYAQLLWSVPKFPPALGLCSPFQEELDTLSLRIFVDGRPLADPVRHYINAPTHGENAADLIGAENLLALSKLSLTYLLLPKEPEPTEADNATSTAPELKIFDTLTDHIEFDKRPNLNTRIRNELARRKIRFLGQLVRLPLTSLPTGPTTRLAIQTYLEAHDLKLDMDISQWRPPTRHHLEFMETRVDTLIMSPIGATNKTMLTLLARAGAVTLGDLIGLRKNDLLAVPYFNIGHYHEIRGYLKELGLDFDEYNS